jgi:hypothetical protein
MAENGNSTETLLLNQTEETQASENAFSNPSIQAPVSGISLAETTIDLQFLGREQALWLRRKIGRAKGFVQMINNLMEKHAFTQVTFKQTYTRMDPTDEAAVATCAIARALESLFEILCFHNSPTFRGRGGEVLRHRYPRMLAWMRNENGVQEHPEVQDQRNATAHTFGTGGVYRLHGHDEARRNLFEVDQFWIVWTRFLEGLLPELEDLEAILEDAASFPLWEELHPPQAVDPATRAAAGISELDVTELTAEQITFGRNLRRSPWGLKAWWLRARAVTAAAVRNFHYHQDRRWTSIAAAWGGAEIRYIYRKFVAAMILEDQAQAARPTGFEGDAQLSTIPEGD